MKKKVAVSLFVVVLLVLSAVVYVGQQRGSRAELYYSGVIEATQSELSFQVAGRVVDVFVDEGYRVNQDQVLARLDASEYRARCEEAQARMRKSGKSLRQLETQLEIYEKSLPADVLRAKANLSSTRNTFEEALKQKKRYDVLFQNGVVSERDWDAVTLNHDTAQARQAESEAALQQAESNLQLIDATKQEIEAAKAEVHVAEAALELAKIQLDYTVLKSPFSGIITSRNVEPGEVVSPGRKAFTLADLTTVDLKIFVDEADLGHVKPGQDVEVRTDTFPDKVYRGTVGYISPDGEFTPKIIQTHKERVKLVYLVKVVVPNPDLELKTGMPADAWLK